MCLLKGVPNMCDHSLGLRLNFSHATKGLEGKARLCNPLQHSVYHRGLLGSNRAHWISEVSEWQLADELLRQEDGLKEVFITPTATFASSRPLEPNLYLSTYYSLARSLQTLSLSLISRGPGPRSALPTVNIDHGVLPHLRDWLLSARLQQELCYI